MRFVVVLFSFQILSWLPGGFNDRKTIFPVLFVFFPPYKTIKWKWKHYNNFTTKQHGWKKSEKNAKYNFFVFACENECLKSMGMETFIMLYFSETVIFIYLFSPFLHICFVFSDFEIFIYTVFSQVLYSLSKKYIFTTWIMQVSTDQTSTSSIFYIQNKQYNF